MNDFGTQWMLTKMDERRRRMSRDSADRNSRQHHSEEDYYDGLDSRRSSRDMGEPQMDYLGDMRKTMHLTKSDGNKWLHEMENTDGTKGPHYTMQEVMQAAEKLGIKFNDFNEREFYIAVNMWYSDYGHITKRIVGDNKEKELLINADYAKAFFEDPDGVEAPEKLAVVYYCMRD